MSEPTPDPIEAWEAACASAVDGHKVGRICLAGDALVTALEAERRSRERWRSGCERERVDHAATRRALAALLAYDTEIGVSDSYAHDAARAAVGSEETPPARFVPRYPLGEEPGFPREAAGETPPKKTAP